MTSKSVCPRAWQATAAEDGRLSERERASFERHLVACDACAREVHALAQLQQALERLPILTSTPLEQRRFWLALLRNVNKRVVSSPRAPRMGRCRIFAVAAAASVLGFVLWFGAVSPARVGAPVFRIAASEGGEWRILERGASLRLLAKKGRFDVTVEKLERGQSFLLSLPDGEIEVVGTRFIVASDATRTRSVNVIEGQVILKLHKAQGRLALNAGDVWTAETSLVHRATAQQGSGGAGGMQPTATGKAGEPQTPTFAPEAAPKPQTGQHQPASPTVTGMAHAATAHVSAGRDFALAMAAFSAGDYGRAERLLLEFGRDHPSDARVEDATFLIAVSRSQRGDVDGAGKMAREYLQRYPNGLRRVEAEALAR